MRLLLRYSLAHWRTLVATFFLATINQLFLLADPQIVRILVDRYALRIGEMPREVFLRGALFWVGAAVGLALIARIARTFQEYSIQLVARKIGAQLYANSVAHSLLLPFDVHEDHRSGELMHTMQRARIDAENGMASAVRLYIGALGVLAVSGYAFYVHPLLGWMHVVLIGLVAVFMIRISEPIHRHQQRITAESADEAGATTEMMRSVELVKSMGIEEQEIDRLQRVTDRILDLEARKLRLVRIFNFSAGTVTSIARAAIMLAMLWLLAQRAISVGEFLTIFLYSNAAFAPLAEVGNAAVRYQQARATFGQLDQVLSIAKPEKDPDATNIGPLTSIEFRNVSLVYANGQVALDGIDLEVRAGETVAFVGRSGAGKSSIAKLLVGLYEPTSGAIAFNGVDARDADRDDIRRRIGIVAHDTHLFAGTLRDNLLVAVPDATDERLLEALDRAAASPILKRGGRGLDTRLGEGGLRLSGGERQRIAIARALLRDPELLIFDEATSNLDAITEAEIVQTMRSVAAPNRITIVIAHRLTTVESADRVVMLEQGRIVERHTRDEVLA